MKRILILLVLIGAVIALGISVIFQRVDRIVLKERSDAETTALFEAARSAQIGRIPYDWSAAAFVPIDVLQEAATLTKGMKILVPPVHGLPPDLTLEVVRMRLSSDDGFATADLALIAKSPSKNVEVSLAASGVLRYLGTDHTKPAPEGWRNLKFGIDLTDVRLGASIGFVQFRARNLAARLLRSGLAASVGDKCALSIPVPAVVRADLGLNGTEALKAGDASVGLEWKVPTLHLIEQVEIAGPVFSKKGMWLLANRQALTPPPIDYSRPTRAEARKIVMDSLDAAPFADGHSFIWVNRTVLEHLVASVNGINPTVSAKVASVEGQLYHEKWDFFGSGELKVEVDGVAGQGSLRIGAITTAWKPNEGVEVTVPLTALANVPIHIHLDPGPTGGQGFDVGIEGSSPPVSMVATLRPEIVSLAGRKALILRIAGSSQKARLDITTDGNFKCSVGTAHVAKVGVAITADLNPEGIPPLLLFSEVPRFEKIEVEGIQLAQAGMEISATPEKLSVTDQGLLLEAKVRLLPADADGQDSTVLADVRQACRALAIGKAVRDINVTILAAGLEFSQNNDIVRFFGNAIKDITQGPGPGNEFVKAVDTVAHDITQGLGPNNDIRKWFRSPGPQTEKFLSSTAEKAVGVAEKGGKELEKLTQKAGKEIEKLPEKVIKVITDPGSIFRRR